jgi:hypothetical protein
MFSSAQVQAQATQALLQQQQNQGLLLAACRLLQQQNTSTGAAAFRPSSTNFTKNALISWTQAHAAASPSPSPPSEVASTSSASSVTADSSTTTDELSDDDFFSESADHNEDRDTKNETFPMKLYRMLYETDTNGKSDIVSFAPSGKAFYIHKPDVFMAEIMPIYFTTTRMASFQRQLNVSALLAS